MLISKRMRGLCLGGWLVSAVIGLWSAAAMGQVVPTATGPGRSLWAGGEYANFEADFPHGSSQRLWGIGAFADYHVAGHFSAEAEAEFLDFNGFNGETEGAYLAGPRYSFRSFGKLRPYAQCLAGLGTIHYPFKIGSGSYLAIAPAGGVEYRLGRRWKVQGGYEYQLWPDSPNIAGEPKHAISPNGFQVGVAFRVLR